MTTRRSSTSDRKFGGGVAVIRVGAATETEMKYLKLKVEDAVNATKAAIEEGRRRGRRSVSRQGGSKSVPETQR